VRGKLRYVRETIAEELLSSVRSSRNTRLRKLPKGSIYWRARLGSASEIMVDGHVSWEEERPFTERDMKPISNWQSEGRANPRRIPYLYLASTRETALAEVRPWIGSSISVAQFSTERDLTVIDCAKNHEKKMLRTLVLYDKMLDEKDGIWMAIDQAFAEPVTRNEESGQYIPTQIIAELFKNQGYDGILYKSVLSRDGYNLALFDVYDASMVDCTLYTVGSISFDFQPLEVSRGR
jgi:RES domain